MMRTTLSIHVHGARAEAQLFRSSGWLRPRDALVAQCSVPIERGAEAQAMASLGTELLRQGAPLAGAKLQAQLGLRYTRVGLLRLADGSGIDLSFDTQQAYVTAWAREVLHLDPEVHVFRWQVLRNPQVMLVSCVSAATYLALEGFSSSHGMRFTSCIPALLTAVRAARRDRATQTLVWTEVGGAPDDAREAAVQIIRFDASQPTATWRGWLPAAPRGSQGDPALEGALQRFEARYGPVTTRPIVHQRWPASADALAAGGH